MDKHTNRTECPSERVHDKVYMIYLVFSSPFIYLFPPSARSHDAAVKRLSLRGVDHGFKSRFGTHDFFFWVRQLG